LENRAGETRHTVWTVTDGRAGNVAQAAGLAEALARRLALAVSDIRPEIGRAALLPPALWHALGRAAPRTVRRLMDPRQSLSPPWPALAIGAGRRAAPLVAGLRGEGARTVQLLAPQMPADAFDLVIAPEHDGLTGPNVLTSVGALGRMTPARIAAEADAWHERIAPLPCPRLAVLLGGPGRMAGWSDEDAARFLSAMTGLADRGWTLLLTASRRSDPALVAGLRRALGPEGHLVHDGTGANPYPAILGLADAVLVTEDSVNMASEAASTGLPLHVFRLGRRSAKAARFHDSLAARGIARPFEGDIGRWSYAPLAEADRLAAQVVARLLPDA